MIDRLCTLHSPINLGALVSQEHLAPLAAAVLTHLAVVPLAVIPGRTIRAALCVALMVRARNPYSRLPVGDIGATCGVPWFACLCAGPPSLLPVVMDSGFGAFAPPRNDGCEMRECSR